MANALEKSLPYYEQLYHSIKQMIFDGVFSPGQRIYEAKIAREFNVSRSPIREAVRALVKDGLLVADDKFQITVYNPAIRDVEEIYQCRMALESLATKLTTKMASDEELEVISHLLDETEQLINQPNKNNGKILECNAQFHDLITKFSQNRRLQMQIDVLKALAYYFRIMNFQGENRDRVIFEEHKKVFQYIKQREAIQSSVEMEKHISNDLNHLKEIVNNRSH